MDENEPKFGSVHITKTSKNTTFSLKATSGMKLTNKKQSAFVFEEETFLFSVEDIFLLFRL